MKARLACGFFAVESFFGPVSKKAGAFNAQIPPPKTKIFNTLKKRIYSTGRDGEPRASTALFYPTRNALRWGRGGSRRACRPESFV